jgi:hypothetical protein
MSSLAGGCLLVLAGVAEQCGQVIGGEFPVERAVQLKWFTKASRA